MYVCKSIKKQVFKFKLKFVFITFFMYFDKIMILMHDIIAKKSTEIYGQMFGY